MNKFKYKFTKITFWLIVAGIIFSAVGIGLNIYLIITDDIASVANIALPIIKYVLMFIVPAVLILVLVSLLFDSYYSVDDKKLKTSFGIIKSSYPLDKISEIILDRNSNKLALRLDDNTLLFIVIGEDNYEQFTNALCKANAGIEYTINSKDDDEKKDS